MYLGGKRYWFDSNDNVRPDEYDWYKILGNDEGVTRPLGQTDIQVKYNVQNNYSILLYQRSFTSTSVFSTFSNLLKRR